MRILFIILLFISTLSSNTIKIDTNTSDLEILSKSQFYIDNKKILTLNQVKDLDNFTNINKTMLSYRYSPNFNLWIKFKIENTTNQKVEKTIEYGSPLTTNISFYENNNLLKKDGLFQKDKKRKSINPHFKISLNPKETKTYFIKANSHITILQVKLKLFEPEELFNEEIIKQSILSLFLGAMMILVFYNLFIYFFSKDVSYIFYILYVLGVTYHQLLYSGILFIYIPNINVIENLIFLSPIASAFPIYSLALFSKVFLKLKKYKKLDFMMNIFLVLIPLSIAIPLISNQWSSLRNLFSMLLLIYIIIVAIYLALKRNKQAYFIITGWVIIFVAIIFMYLNSIGIFSIYQYLTYYVEGSFLFEAVIFSIALADKINSLNEKFIKQKQTEKIRLKSEVNKRTNELQTKVQEKEDLLKELNHRVKNNIQNIISLIRIQSDEIKNKKTVEQFISIENRLSAMNHLHEILYKKSDISKVNCYQYLESIVDNLQESYEKDYVDIKYEVNTKLEMETKSISSFGLIVNELVTNTFKYAFEDEKGNLSIKLTLKDEIYKLVIKDDGRGCQLSDFKTSFGISLVKDLVEEHLLGSIKSKIGNGIKHTIEWRKK